MNNAVANKMPDQPVEIRHDEGSQIISMIERAARDPNVDVSKMERLFEMQERAQDRRAKMAFASALAEMQPKLPTVDRKGAITIKKKDSQEVIQSTPYALWEDINEAIRPFLSEFGFALTFKTGTTPEGKITVTGILSHREGHSEDTTMMLMHDSTGSKNSVQAIGSSISYGKRYTAGLLLNITSRAPLEADDDGKVAGALQVISEEQIDHIRSLLIETASDIPRFLQFMKVEKIEDIEPRFVDKAIRALETKRGKL